MRLAAIAALLGALSGAWLCDAHHDAKDTLAALNKTRAELEFNLAIQRQADEYYSLYKAASDRPVPPVQRVYVKADCPVRDATGASLGDGTDTSRVELNPASVGRVTAITEEGETSNRLCAIKLAYFHSIFPQHTR